MCGGTMERGAIGRTGRPAPAPTFLERGLCIWKGVTRALGVDNPTYMAGPSKDFPVRLSQLPTHRERETAHCGQSNAGSAQLAQVSQPASEPWASSHPAPSPFHSQPGPPHGLSPVSLSARQASQLLP